MFIIKVIIQSDKPHYLEDIDRHFVPIFTDNVKKAKRYFNAKEIQLTDGYWITSLIHPEIVEEPD